jgi:ribosome-associated protein
MSEDLQYDEDFELPSKSELKRQQSELQNLVGEIIELPKNSLEALENSGQAMQEILVAADMSPSSARNRQVRFIAKLIGKEPEFLSELQKLIEKTQQAKQQNANQLHLAEYWREKLLAGEDQEVFEFCEKFKEADNQRLRQLRREYLKYSRTDGLSQKQVSSSEQRQKEIRRKFFKLVSESIQSSESH